MESESEANVINIQGYISSSIVVNMLEEVRSIFNSIDILRLYSLSIKCTFSIYNVIHNISFISINSVFYARRCILFEIIYLH